MNQLVNEYINRANADLAEERNMLELLQKRLLLCRQNFAEKSELERTEVEILEIKTRQEMLVLRKKLLRMTDYLEKYFKQFQLDLAELDENYEKTLNEATKCKDSVKGLRDFLHAVKWNVINTDLHSKIALYKDLKNFMKK